MGQCVDGAGGGGGGGAAAPTGSAAARCPDAHREQNYRLHHQTNT